MLYEVITANCRETGVCTDGLSTRRGQASNSADNHERLKVQLSSDPLRNTDSVVSARVRAQLKLVQIRNNFV